VKGTWQSSGTGPGPVVAVIVVLILASSGVGSAIASAVVTLVIVLGCVVGVAVLGGIAWLVYRARRAPGIGTRGSDLGLHAGPEIRHSVADLRRPAIEPPREVHLHFHGADPAEAAEVIRRALERN
jgi:hypothetical protein